MAKEKVEMKVSKETVPGKLAGSIIKTLRDEDKEADIVCIGAGAVNQTMKALAVARGMGAVSGVEPVAVSYFDERDTNEGHMTVLHILVQKR